MVVLARGNQFRNQARKQKSNWDRIGMEQQAASNQTNPNFWIFKIWFSWCCCCPVTFEWIFGLVDWLLKIESFPQMISIQQSTNNRQWMNQSKKRKIARELKEWMVNEFMKWDWMVWMKKAAMTLDEWRMNESMQRRPEVWLKFRMHNDELKLN